MNISIRYSLLALLLLPAVLPAQSSAELQQILERLSRLEAENQRLNTEVKELREALRGSQASAPNAVAIVESSEGNAEPAETPEQVPVEERVAVQEVRVNELARTSVQTSQRLPVSLTGMILFNSYINGSANGGAQNPLIAAPENSSSGNGASPRQSIVGFRYQGPQILGGGQVTASLNMDLWGGSSNSLNHTIRLRTADFRVDWKNQSLMVGQDKPLISPRDPTSLAQVAYSPLTASGNLWLWQPQVRFEQRFGFGASSGLRAQASLYQTSEPGVQTTVSEGYGTSSAARPALQGRFEFWHDFTPTRRIEIAPGFHTSQSHVGRYSIPSRLFNIDWLIKPAAAWEFTGAFFQGRNAAGLGGLRQGFTYLGPRDFVPVHTAGGWAQLAWLPTQRLSFHAYGGQESNRSADLLSGQITRNRTVAGNAFYRFGTNILVGLEVSQVRTRYKPGTVRILNHYDLALAYLF